MGSDTLSAAIDHMRSWAMHEGRVTHKPAQVGAIFGVQVPGRAGHSEASEVQLRKGDRAWRGSMERKP